MNREDTGQDRAEKASIPTNITGLLKSQRVCATFSVTNSVIVLE